jgi:hypothetical protein
MPPIDRIDDDDEDVVPSTLAAFSQVRAGGGAQQQQLKCYACGEVSKDAMIAFLFGFLRSLIIVVDPVTPFTPDRPLEGRLPESRSSEQMHR